MEVIGKEFGYEFVVSVLLNCSIGIFIFKVLLQKSALKMEISGAARKT